MVQWEIRVMGADRGYKWELETQCVLPSQRNLIWVAGNSLGSKGFQRDIGTSLTECQLVYTNIGASFNSIFSKFKK